ncbi:hypothetical protein DI487_15950 [Flavobacterium sediminis]|uniref:Uncharacterized protein n=1 Tax=Flavobacterium sediminis TaxID=2201181 RepID=A0A2U8QZA6_9FLAO|nr:hypothetical protein [Flavobacterium sediminis]AWM15204.1 hypothetical protein DI487_15950 [Flavobacterium sediminis]
MKQVIIFFIGIFFSTNFLGCKYNKIIHLSEAKDTLYNCNGINYKIFNLSKGVKDTFYFKIFKSDIVYKEILIRTRKKKMTVEEIVTKNNKKFKIRKDYIFKKKYDRPIDLKELIHLNNLSTYSPYVDSDECIDMKTENDYKVYFLDLLEESIDSFWTEENHKFIFTHYQKTNFSKNKIIKVGNKINSFKNPTFSEDIDTFFVARLDKDRTHLKGTDNNRGLVIDVRKDGDNYIESNTIKEEVKKIINSW